MKSGVNNAWSKVIEGKLLVPFLLFLTALLPRAISLGTTMTADEHLWVARSLLFIKAVKTGDWASTFQSGHPGVPTMWISGTALELFYSDGMAHVEKMFIAQFPIALATSLSIVLLFLLAKKVFNFRVAILGALLLAFDPESIAHSRVIHLDAMLAAGMILSVLSLLAYLNDSDKKRYLLSAGFFTGVALLTKLPSVFLVLFLPATTIAWALCTEADFPDFQNALAQIKPILILAIVTILVLFCLWPVLWVEPAGTIHTLFETGKAAKAVAHSSGFSMGQVSNGGYGLSYYPIILFMKSTPVTLLLLVICLAGLAKDIKTNGLSPANKSALALLFYVALFMLQMTLGAKKGERYLLPVFPAVAILASIGFYYASDFFTKRLPTFFAKKFSISMDGRKKIVMECMLSAVIFCQAGLSLPLHPYYLSYFNPVIGGAQQALKIMVFGWGEGLDLAADYLNEKPGANRLVVAAQYSGLEPFFKGKTVGMDEALSADYLVFYVSAVQRDWNKATWDIYRIRIPEKTIFINDIPYAYVYKNKSNIKDGIASKPLPA